MGERLARLLAARTGARAVRVLDLAPLGGGAIQENWRLDADFEGGRLDGCQALVLRTDAPSAVPFSLSRAQEFRVLEAAFAAGVAVPEPLLLEEDPAVIGRPFHIMRRVEGVAAGHRLVRMAMAEAAREALVERLGAELARIHAVRPPREDLAFLPLPQRPAAAERIARYRRSLDALA
ncbi:MAG: phosphotransferase, partial [Rhodospirillaceae bacterium]|nr:phosphotransferase [Rhodospirillaceae bacterium]